MTIDEVKDIVSGLTLAERWVLRSPVKFDAEWHTLKGLEAKGLVKDMTQAGLGFIATDLGRRVGDRLRLPPDPPRTMKG